MLKINIDSYKKNLTEEQIDNFVYFISSAAKGEIEFTYKKKNGDLRVSRGTINIDSVKDYLPELSYLYLSELFDLDKEVSDFSEESISDYFLYFDTEAMDIRQFNPSKLELLPKGYEQVEYTIVSNK